MYIICNLILCWEHFYINFNNYSKIQLIAVYPQMIISFMNNLFFKVVCKEILFTFFIIAEAEEIDPKYHSCLDNTL